MTALDEAAKRFSKARKVAGQQEDELVERQAREREALFGDDAAHEM